MILMLSSLEISFVVPCGISRRGHCFSEVCSSRTLCGCACASRSRRGGAYRSCFVYSRPHAARNMFIAQFITFAPGTQVIGLLEIALITLELN